MTLAESNGEVQLVEVGNRRVADQFKRRREWHLFRHKSQAINDAVGNDRVDVHGKNS